MKKIISVILYILSALGIALYFILASRVSPFLRAGLYAIVCVAALTASLILHDRRLTKTVLIVLFFVYLHLLLSMLFLDNYFGRTSAYSSVNLIPFKTIIGYFKADAYSFAVNIIGNLAAFMPFAFFLPLLFKAHRNLGVFLLSITAVVVIVELLQYILGCGACDVDDLLLNVGGAWIAHILVNNFLKST